MTIHCDQDPAQISPVVLATASHVPPVTLLHLALSAVTVRQRNPPNIVLQREMIAMRTHARQCEASLAL